MWGWWLLAPDGRGVYCFGSRAPEATPDPETHQTPMLLRRLDPRTLRVEAERALTAFYTGFMLLRRCPVVVKFDEDRRHQDDEADARHVHCLTTLLH